MDGAVLAKVEFSAIVYDWWLRKQVEQLQGSVHS